MGNKFFGLKDFSKKWQYINRDNKQRALINGLTIAGIAIGALLTIASSKSLNELFGMDSKDNER